MNLFSFSSLLILISSTIISLFVFWKGRKQKAATIFAIFCLLVSLWGLGGYGFSTARSREVAFFWWQVAFIGIASPVVYTHFIFSLLKIHKKTLLIFSYILTIIFLCFNFFKRTMFLGDLRFAFGQFYWLDWQKYKSPIFLIFYLFFYWGLLLYLFALLIKECRSASGFRYAQLKYLIFGSAIGWLGPHGDFLLTFGANIYPYSNFLTVLYPAIIAYAIVRHQLMDIEVVIKKTIVFAGLFVAVYAVFSFFALLGQLFFEKFFTANRWIAMLPSVIAVTFMLRPLESFLINITNKYLFQKKYNYRELLRTFTVEVLTVLNLQKLVDLTIDKLVDIVKLVSCTVLLFDDEKQQFNVMASHGIKDPSVKLIYPDGIVTFLRQTHGYLLKSELAEKKVFIPDSIKDIMDKLNAELIIPMVLHDEVMGVLSLGKKKSDEDYTQDDLDILLPLARTLAIAISNAQLFDELGKTQAEAAQKEKMATIGTLSAGINHEICNPLGIARGQCEAYLLNIKDGLYNNKSPDELLEKAKEIMSKVIKEVDRATVITKKLSNFAKPSKGVKEPINIDKEVDEVLALVGYELKLEKIEVAKQIEKGLPDIYADKKQFQEVLFNLIRNAGQAIGEKGKITVFAKKSKDTVFIDIQDTGSGIPEDKIKELFNPFFTTKEPGKGTGLGLFIVRQVVEKNGGKIYLKETKVGQGTTFIIEFPVTVPQGVRT